MVERLYGISPPFITNSLGLSDTELDQITAGILAIGDANSGSITVSQDITRPSTTQVTLTSGGSILLSGGQINTAGGTLILQPGASGSVQPIKAATDATASNLYFAVGATLGIAINGTTADSQYTQLNAAAAVNLMNASLALSGSYVPSIGDSFTVVSATSLTNTFNSLPNNATLVFNGYLLRINYTSTAAILTTLSVAPAVQSITVNGGSVQRSRLTTIAVNFASPVNAATLTGLGAITLTRTDTPPTGGVIGTVVETGASGANGRITVSPSSGMVSNITLTFDNADGSGTTAGVEYGSLADGDWQLAIPSLAYTSTAGDPNLHRLFGDINGDSTISAGIDQGAFVNTFGISYDPNNLNNGYNAAFDFNGDGTISAGIDQAAFVNRFGLTLQ